MHIKSKIIYNYLSKDKITVKDFLQEMDDLYGNMVMEQGTTPMPYIMTSEELASKVLLWTDLINTQLQFVIENLIKDWSNKLGVAHRGDFTKVNINEFLPFKWNK